MAFFFALKCKYAYNTHNTVSVQAVFSMNGIKLNYFCGSSHENKLLLQKSFMLFNR